jgi:predicted AlkP superfamily phosphohydrolase/phosphomutase
MTARLLMIGLDGADSNLIDRWSLDGTLPNIGKLRARGSAHHLEAPHGITDDALWANFQYAAGLGVHGRFNYAQRLDNGQIGMAFNDERDRERFWDRLSAAGQRVAVFDLPKTIAGKPLNGIHLADWLTHGKYFKSPRSYPEGLAAEVVEKFGPAPLSRCGYIVETDEAIRRDVAANLLRSAAMKGAAGVHYLGQEAWDLFVIGFKEMHCAGHNFWDVVDVSHPHFDARLRDRLGDPARTIFQRVDQAVGDLIAAAGPEAMVVLFATTKMEPNASIRHFDPRLERRLNRKLTENPITQAIRRQRKVAAPIEVMPYNENGTAIRINRKGRAGAKLLGDVEQIFANLTDADTGEKLAHEMFHPSVDYQGPRARKLPDLLIRYRAGLVPNAIASPRLGRMDQPAPQYRTGNHACGPFVIAAGTDPTSIRELEDFGGFAERVLLG